MESEDVERDNDNAENNPEDTDVEQNNEDISNEPQDTEQNENDHIEDMKKDENVLNAVEEPENDFSNDSEQDELNDVDGEKTEDTVNTEVERKTEDTSKETPEDVDGKISEGIDKDAINEPEQDVMANDMEDKKSDIDHVIAAVESEEMSARNNDSSVDIESAEDVTASTVLKEDEQSNERDNNQSDTVKEELSEVFSKAYDTVSDNENSENSGGSFKEWLSDKLYEEYGAKMERIADILDGAVEMNYTDNIIETVATALVETIADKLEEMRSSDNGMDSSATENMVEVTQDIMSTIGETVGSSMMQDVESTVTDAAVSLDGMTADIVDRGLEGLLNSEVFNDIDTSANTADEVTGEQPEMFSDDATSNQMTEALMNDIEQYYQNEVDFGIDVESDQVDLNRDEAIDTQDVDYTQYDDEVDWSLEQRVPAFAEDFITEAVDAEDFSALLL